MSGCHLRSVYAALEACIPQVQSIEDAVTTGLVLAAVAPDEVQAAMVIALVADIGEVLTPDQADACYTRARFILGPGGSEVLH